MYLARISVTLKEGVLDPQGTSVAGALAALGFAGVSEVRVGKLIELRLEAASREEAAAQVEGMCQRLLANPVLEGYSFQLEEVGA